MSQYGNTTALAALLSADTQAPSERFDELRTAPGGEEPQEDRSCENDDLRQPAEPRNVAAPWSAPRSTTTLTLPRSSAGMTKARLTVTV